MSDWHLLSPLMSVDLFKIYEHGYWSKIAPRQLCAWVLPVSIKELIIFMLCVTEQAQTKKKAHEMQCFSLLIIL